MSDERKLFKFIFCQKEKPFSPEKEKKTPVPWIWTANNYDESFIIENSQNIWNRRGKEMFIAFLTFVKSAWSHGKKWWFISQLVVTSIYGFTYVKCTGNSSSHVKCLKCLVSLICSNVDAISLYTYMTFERKKEDWIRNMQWSNITITSWQETQRQHVHAMVRPLL